MMSEMLSREGSLVGKLTLERHRSQLATVAKVRADRLTQVQHMVALDARIRMDRQTEIMLAKATRAAVVQAVNTLTTKPRSRPLPVSSLQAAGVVGSAAAPPLVPPANANGDSTAATNSIPEGAAASTENLRSIGARAKQLLTPALKREGAKVGLLGRIKQGARGGGSGDQPQAAAASNAAPSASGSGASPNRYMERQEKEVCR